MIATRTWGEGPRTALLVHGITSSAATMWELGEGLAAAGWTATAADLPGHGLTGAADSYRIADSAEALAALAPRWDLYVGHSLGGAIGVQLLATHPGVAARAVLLDPALFLPPERAQQVADSFVASLATSVEQVRAEHPHWHPRTVEARVEASRRALPDAVHATVLDSQPWDLRGAAARVTVPVHVLVAERESALRPGVLEAIEQANPRWKSEVVPDTTHSLHRDQPALVLERVLAG